MKSILGADRLIKLLTNVENLASELKKLGRPTCGPGFDRSSDETKIGWSRRIEYSDFHDEQSWYGSYRCACDEVCQILPNADTEDKILKRQLTKHQIFAPHKIKKGRDNACYGLIEKNHFHVWTFTATQRGYWEKPSGFFSGAKRFVLSRCLNCKTYSLIDLTSTGAYRSVKWQTPTKILDEYQEHFGAFGLIWPHDVFPANKDQSFAFPAKDYWPLHRFEDDHYFYFY